MTAATTTPKPTADELRAALAVFLRAWAPRSPAPADDVDEGDGPDETNGCGCGGEDEAGDPICTCHGSCSCPRCDHDRYARAKRCSVSGCGQRTAYRIVAWCVHRDGVHRSSSPDDPAAARGMVTLGDSVQRHSPLYACTTQHARALIEQDRQTRVQHEAGGVGDALTAARTYYEVELWDYQPDDIDVPGPLIPLAHDLESAARWVRRTIGVPYAGQHPEYANPWADARWTIEGAQQAIAMGLEHLLDYLDERDQAAAADD